MGETTYDLEYNFPLTFFGFNDGLKINRNFFEASVSEGKDMNVIRTNNSLICSLSISELERRFLANYDKMKEKLKKKSFPVTMCNFRTHKGANVFHFLIKDFKILKKFQYSYMKFIEQFEDEDDKKKYFELFLFILYPNRKEVSPFDLALKESSQFVNLFLEMLAQVPDYSLSRFIFKDIIVFKQLMDMGLKSFETFLDRCLYQSLTMQKIFVRYWKHGDESEHIYQSNSSLITNGQLNKHIGSSDENTREEPGAQYKTLEESQLNSAEEIKEIRRQRFKNLECQLS